MRAEKFSEAMNGIGDKYIQEASMKKNRIAKPVKIAGIVAAACAALFLIIVGVGFVGAVAGRAGGSQTKSADGEYPEWSTNAYAPERNYEAGSYSDKSSAYRDNMDEIASEPSDGVPSEGANSDGSMIVYMAEINMTVDDVLGTVDDIDALLKDLGGFFENRQVESSKRPSAYLVARVPADKLTQFTDALNATGDVTYFVQNGEDVSGYYHDNESRLETSKAKLKRLQELLAKASDISDIIEIESAIEEAEYEVDYYTGILNGMDSKVSYATVTITIEQGEIVATPDEMTFGERIGQAFNDGIESFGNFFEDAAVFFARNWIVLVIVVIIVVAAIVIPLKVIKKKNK